MCQIMDSGMLRNKAFSLSCTSLSSIDVRRGNGSLFWYFNQKTKRKFDLGLIFSFIILTVVVPIKAVNIHSITVPDYHKSGYPVTLKCNYNMEGEKLYSVKWYRDSQEFFHYVEGNKPPTQDFKLKGVTVNTALSDSQQVSLQNVTRETSGKYKCEVTADLSFHTATIESEMFVVDVPDSVPAITGSRPRYHVGEEVHVNCTSKKSRPAAALTWYINRDQAIKDQVVEYAPEQDENGLETSRLGLKFIATPKHFPEGVLKIRCTATIAAVYWQSAEEAVEGQLPQTSPALESKGVYTGKLASGGCSTMSGKEEKQVMLMSLFLFFSLKFKSS